MYKMPPVAKGFTLQHEIGKIAAPNTAECLVILSAIAIAIAQIVADVLGRLDHLFVAYVGVPAGETGASALALLSIRNGRTEEERSEELHDEIIKGKKRCGFLELVQKWAETVEVGRMFFPRLHCLGRGPLHTFLSFKRRLRVYNTLHLSTCSQ
jgi:hypothetical protein